MDPITRVLSKTISDDQAAGEFLTRLVVTEALADEAEVLEPLLLRAQSAVTLTKSANLRRHLGRMFVQARVTDAPVEGVVKMANYVADLERLTLDATNTAISKASFMDFFTRRDGRRQEVRRDAATGQFVRGLGGAPQNPTQFEEKKQFPGAKAVIEAAEEKDGKSGYLALPDGDQKKLAARQGEYTRLRAVADAVKNIPGAKMNIIFGDGGAPREVLASDVLDGNLPEQWTIERSAAAVAITSDDPVGRKQITAFNTLGFAGGALEDLAGGDPARWSALAQKLAPAAPDSDKLSTFFSQLEAGADVLEGVPGGAAAGEIARFVGTFGPEANKVLGPKIQQAAYRYRGTEREPDIELVAAFNSRPVKVVDALADDRLPEEQKQRAIETLTAPVDFKDAPSGDLSGFANRAAATTYGRSRKERLSADQTKMAVRADLATRYLIDQLPDDPVVAELSEKSGNILPSQGIAIDADGDVVSQAVGYSDDHYLPFNLSGLGSIRGGQYARTRVSGGPTSEDIYTMVQAGVRSATIVSTSGVYTIELDPSFRGARGLSDRARQMYERYIKILDAVEGSGMYLKDLDPPTKAKIRQDALRESGGDEANMKRLIEAKTRKARLGATKALTQQQLDAAYEEAKVEAENELRGKKFSNTAFAQLSGEIFDEKVRDLRQEQGISRLQLNAEGYSVALETLQAQFPYFIRNVSWQPLRSAEDSRGKERRGFLDSRGESTISGLRQNLGRVDAGYVAPGGLRSDNAKEGFYRTADEWSGGVRGKRPEKMSEEKRIAREAWANAQRTAGTTPAASGQPNSQSGANQNANSNTQAQQALSSGEATGLNARIVNVKGQLTEDVTKQMDMFVSEVSRFVSFTTDVNSNYENGTWETVRDNPSRAAQFLVKEAFQDPRAFKALVDSDPARVAAAFEKPEQATAALRSMMIRDGATLRMEDGETLFGKEDINAGVKEMTTRLREIGDLAMWRADGAFAQKSEPTVVGDKPQQYDFVANLNKPEDFTALLQNGSEEAPGLLQAYETLAAGDVSLASVRSRVKDLVSRIKDVQQNWNAGQEVLSSESSTFAQVAQAMAVNPSTLTELTGADTKDNLALVDVESLTSKANDYQAAWAFMTAQRLYEYLEGGGGYPKVREARSVAKSRVVKRLRVDRTDLRVMAERQALGLPPLVLPR